MKAWDVTVNTNYCHLLSLYTSPLHLFVYLFIALLKGIPTPSPLEMGLNCIWYSYI